FALFVCLLGAAILLVYAAGSMPPASLARIVRFVGGGLLGIVALVLLVTGRMGLAIPAALASFALFQGNLGRLTSFARNIPGAGGFGGGPSSGQTSDIETAWLSMWLDHDTGKMGGRVRQGTFSGAQLEQMSLDDLRSLRSELIADDESLRLLDSFIERVHGQSAGDDTAEEADEGSAGRSGAHGGGRGAGGAGMSVDEAWDVLGLSPGASAEEIKLAHRALMQKVHPDRGGSSYLATKLNQAKDMLLAGMKTR
ncbi:MAG: DnaJ domain-containing protein, partial [Pseudomonadota bacterium]